MIIFFYLAKIQNIGYLCQNGTWWNNKADSIHNNKKEAFLIIWKVFFDFKGEDNGKN